MRQALRTTPAPPSANPAPPVPESRSTLPVDIPPPPHGQLPYRPWPGPYSPYSRPPVNGFAIASLVFGIFCFVPAVGLVLGLVGLAQIKKKGERGKGLAIAGSILSVVGIVLLVLSVATGAARDFAEGFKDAARESRYSGDGFPVDKGGCFDAPDGEIDSMKYTGQVDEVPCSGKHDGEVFASFRVTNKEYPGEDAMIDLAESKCTDLQWAYVMDTWADFDGAQIYYFMPDRTTWRHGDRHGTCIFGAMDPEEPLEGSMRSDATTLDADQLAYVKADRAVDEVYMDAPATERFEDDLEGHKKWAARVDKALAEQARQLRAHDWPTGTQKHIDKLVAEIEKGRKEWAKAAEASDADTFNKHYVAGFQKMGDKSAVPARRSLHLGTTSPRDATPWDGPETGLDEDHGEGGDSEAV
ncbi:hypothetical protein DEJ49_23800 [Streptomyces venezuelae]|uniref:DUF4190 domain-containing protein n=1 Tax=Streptomyces venezuelae TaxID=54571 RepID=A0A5P2CLB2_STRVZ|nr:hypothetical protein DEJ49_23800 [Streptomyces venezuelae]